MTKKSKPEVREPHTRELSIIQVDHFRELIDKMDGLLTFDPVLNKSIRPHIIDIKKYVMAQRARAVQSAFPEGLSDIENDEERAQEERSRALWVDEKVVERNLSDWRQVSEILERIVEWCDMRGSSVSPEELKQLGSFSEGLNQTINEFHRYSKLKCKEPESGDEKEG